MCLPNGRSISVNTSRPLLITWGKNDGIFTVEGAELYKRDIPSAELHLFDGAVSRWKKKWTGLGR